MICGHIWGVSRPGQIKGWWRIHASERLKAGSLWSYTFSIHKYHGTTTQWPFVLAERSPV